MNAKLRKVLRVGHRSRMVDVFPEEARLTSKTAFKAAIEEWKAAGLPSDLGKIPESEVVHYLQGANALMVWCGENCEQMEIIKVRRLMVQIKNAPELWAARKILSKMHELYWQLPDGWEKKRYSKCGQRCSHLK